MGKSYLAASKELSNINIHNSKVKNAKNYFKERWIAIAALIVSALSLAFSIYSLNKADNKPCNCNYQCECCDNER